MDRRTRPTVTQRSRINQFQDDPARITEQQELNAFLYAELQKLQETGRLLCEQCMAGGSLKDLARDLNIPYRRILHLWNKVKRQLRRRLRSLKE
jgi:hypothetical protein